MKYLIFLLIFPVTVHADIFFSVGTDQYIDMGGTSENFAYSVKFSDDYDALTIAYLVNNKFRVGGGVGMFHKTFNSTSPSVGEYQGYDEVDSNESAIALFAEYEYSHFFISGMAAQPEHKETRSRLVQRGVIETEEVSDDDIEYFWNVGFRFIF